MTSRTLTPAESSVAMVRAARVRYRCVYMPLMSGRFRRIQSIVARPDGRLNQISPTAPAPIKAGPYHMYCVVRNRLIARSAAVGSGRVADLAS